MRNEVKMSGAKSMQPRVDLPGYIVPAGGMDHDCKSIFAGIKTERRKVLASDTRHPIENVQNRQSPRIHKR